MEGTTKRESIGLEESLVVDILKHHADNTSRDDGFATTTTTTTTKHQDLTSDEVAELRSLLNKNRQQQQSSSLEEETQPNKFRSSNHNNGSVMLWGLGNYQNPFVKTSLRNSGAVAKKQQSRKYQAPQQIQEGGDTQGPLQDEEGGVGGEQLNNSDNANLVETMLSPDTFSFLVAAPFWSVPYWTALFVFAFKNIIYILVALDMIDMSAPNGNVLSVPVAVETPVLVSQAMAFVIAVFTQNDVIQSLMMIYEGYNEKELGQAFAASSWFKYTTAVLFLFLDGSLGLAVTFMLIVNSSTSLDVLLNFAAVEFVSGLDEAAFYLSDLGFFGSRNQAEARLISNTRYLVPQRHSPVFQVTLMVGILLAILSGWAVVLSRQFSGFFATNTLIVQFDDELRPELGAYTGTYTMKVRAGRQPAQRFWFVEDQHGEGMFAYCGQTRSWSFIVGEEHPCDDPLVESTPTTTFDIVESGIEPWFALRPDTSYAVQMDQFTLSPVCVTTGDCGGDVTCGRNNQCECPPERFGTRCEFRWIDICPEIQIDPRLTSRFGAIREIATTFFLLRTQRGVNVELFQRPVFMNNDTGDLILYLGLRWGVTNIDRLVGLNNTDVGEFLMSDSFRPLRDLSGLDLLSEPMRFFTPQDNELPVGISWFTVINREGLARADLDADNEGSELICAVCNDKTNKCRYDNLCNPDGSCTCLHGEQGRLCELVPLANGHCDVFFNNPAFNFDGGDCCSQTCSGDAFRCGTTTVGNLNLVDVGYSHCKSPSVVEPCSESGGHCFIRNSEVIPPSVPSTFPSVTLSPNGRILVVSEPLLSTIRVFDRFGQTWVPRAQILRGTLDSEFGGTVAIWSPPAAVVERVGAEVPVLLAVGESRNGIVRLPRWSTQKRIWLEEGSIDLQALGILSCAMQCDEFRRVEVGVGLDSVIVVLVQVTERYLNSNVTSDTFVFTRPTQAGWAIQPYGFNSFATLSTDGLVLAVTNETTGRVVAFNTRSPATPIADFDAFGRFPNTVHTVRALQLSNSGDRISIASNVGNAARLFTFQVCSDPTIAQVPRAISNEEPTFGTSEMLSFSSDGSSFARNNGAIVQVFRCNEATTSWLFLSQTEAATKEAGELGTSPFSVSRNGAVVGFPDPRDATVVELRDSCNAGEMVMRLSATVDRNSDGIFWTLCTGLNIGGTVFANRMLGGCDGCYESMYALDDTPENSRSVLVEEMCLPPSLASCLVFSFGGQFGSGPNETVGLAAYLYNENEGIGEPFVFADQRSQLSDTVVATVGPCEPQDAIQCNQATESLFVLGYSGADDLRTIEWRLASPGNTFSSATSTASSSQGFAMIQQCIPNSSCFDFSISNPLTQTTCLDNGVFFALIDGVEVARGDIAGQTLSLGACP